jgi:tetratricopeptide (TPR) repeat protein
MNIPLDFLNILLQPAPTTVPVTQHQNGNVFSPSTIKSSAYTIPAKTYPVAEKSYYEYFVPAPYNICVGFSDEKMVSLRREYSAQNVQGTSVQSVDIRKDLVEYWAKSLDEKIMLQSVIYENQKKLEQMEKSLFDSRPVVNNTPTRETVNDIFAKAVDKLANSKYAYDRDKQIDEALDIFKTTARIPELTATSYYNMACCYSQKNNWSSTILHLECAVKNGYTNWCHTITDEDLSRFRDYAEFVGIIRKMIAKSSLYRPTEYLYNYDITDYAKKHLIKIY